MADGKIRSLPMSTTKERPQRPSSHLISRQLALLWHPQNLLRYSDSHHEKSAGDRPATLAVLVRHAVQAKTGRV